MPASRGWNPDDEWALWREWLGEDPQGRSIYAQVVELMGFRQIFRGFALLYDAAPEEARKNATFVWWVRWNYARSLGSAIRRQVDVREDVISLGRLIDRIWRYPTALTRERFLQVNASADPEEANRRFRDLAGEGEFINPEILAQDLETLREETADARRWVNTAVAHHGARERETPTLSELHRCVDVIFDLSNKYVQLLQGTTVAREPLMSNWPAIFKVAWIPHDQYPKIMRQIQEQVQAADYKDPG